MPAKQQSSSTASKPRQRLVEKHKPDSTTIEVLQTGAEMFPPKPEFSSRAQIKSRKQYEELYKQSIRDPEDFWAERASELLHWERKWERVLKYDFAKPEV